MKIGILTFHRVINDGSILQLYCLYNALRQRFPKARVEVIDCAPRSLIKKNLRSFFTIRFPFINLDQFLKFKSQRSFLNKNLKFSKQRLTSDDVNESSKFISSLNYDVIFVGSDTIWDTRDNGGGGPVPNIYFLPYITSQSIKVALSASIDKGDPKSLPPSTLDECAKYIKGFDAITFRDAATEKFLQELGISVPKIEFLPDPTFIYRFNYLAENISIKQLANVQVVGVALSNPAYYRVLKTLFNKRGYQVINLLGKNKSDLLDVNKLSFEKRLNVFSELDVLISDRFHSSIITLMLGKALVIMVEPSNYYMTEKSSKGFDLFNRLGLKDFVIRVDNSVTLLQRLKPLLKESSMKAFAKKKVAIGDLMDYGVSKFSEICNKLEEDVLMND